MDPIVEWLLGESRALRTAEELCPAFVERLRQAGIPVVRASTSLITQHPEIIALQLSWSPEGLRRDYRVYAQLEAGEFLNSPVQAIIDGAPPIHRRLDEAAVAEFPPLADLRARGLTDYLILPVPYGSGRRAFLSFATDDPRGFEPAVVERLESLIPAFATRIELAAAYYATRSLLSVYLGQRATERVLSGKFRRGGGERITSAIWYCDLRDFTSLTGSLPVDEVLALLDRYFECTAGAIEQEGGDVLKFVGDAVLGIFPCEGAAEPACRAAFSAAQRALSNVAQLSAERTARGLPPVRAGIALHLGEAVFGNIGASRRLDFTVIGAAVNEAARIESLCKPLGTPLLMSRDFVQAAEIPARSFGPQQLKGVSHPIEVFGIDAG